MEHQSVMKILGIIPARYDSSRFPGKPLLDLGGKSMIKRVYEQAQKSKLDQVIVATDDERIYHAVLTFGGKAIMTSSEHTSGTDRCLEALQKSEGNFDGVINIQADEPFIHPEQIQKIAHCLQQNLLAYRIRERSLSKNKLRNVYWIWKINRKFNKLSFVKSLISVVMISINSLRKYGFK